MKIKIAGIFMAFLCLTMIIGSAFAAPVVKPNIVTKTIIVQVNPTTWYHWEPIYIHSFVQLIKNYYTNDPTPYSTTMICGVPGTETFVFKGIKGSKIVLEEFPPESIVPTQSITYTRE